MLCFIFYSFQ